jgi:hypothetical protein
MQPADAHGPRNTDMEFRAYGRRKDGGKVIDLQVCGMGGVRNKMEVMRMLRGRRNADLDKRVVGRVSDRTRTLEDKAVIKRQ